MGFFVVTFHYLDLGTLHVLCSMSHHEAMNVLAKTVITEMRMQKTHPQDCSKIAGHHAIPLSCRDWDNLLFRLGGIALCQRSLELGARHTSSCTKLHNEL